MNEVIFEQILGELKNINGRLSNLEQGIDDLKEYAEETRSATNKLLDWADRAEHAVKIPLDVY